MNEPKVSGLDVRINGGRVESSERDTTIRIYDLEPYRDYFVELRSTGFDYIAWQIRNSNIRVNINANQFKLIEIPISVLGEVSGTVYLNKVGYDSGQERILVNIYNSNSNLVSSVISEEDGYFSYLGLKPGSYSARIDTKQLNDLQMTSIPDELSFEILPTIEGDYADGLEFVLENKKDEYLEDEHKIELKEAIANETVSEEDNENEVSPAQTSEVKESEFDKNGKRFLVLSGSANFKIGRTELQPNPKTGLDRLIGFMEDNPQTYWVIEGHTDDRGNSRQNYRLSLARAKSVLNYFVQNGIDADRFEIIAFGKSRPIADNSKSFGRALNRRVVIQEMGHYKQREGSTPGFSSINYDYENEYNIEGMIFTDNRYYCRQVSAWKTRRKAASEVEKLKAKGHSAFIKIYNSPENKRWYRVRIGYFDNLEAARESSNIIDRKIRRVAALNSINYDYKNEFNIESFIFTDNQYYCIQVSSLKNRNKAAAEVEKLKSKGHSAFIETYDSPENIRWFRVRIGYFKNLEGAREYLKLIP